MKRRRPLLALGLALALGLVADQAVLFLALGDGFVLGRRVAPFDPPIFSPDQQRALAQIERHVRTGEPDEHHFRFDAELGWCPRPGDEIGRQHYDWSSGRVGVRELPRVKAPGARRVLAIGCSFTQGDEVDDGESWPAQLDALREDLEVGNLAMGAYGLDQALLRYRRDGGALDADEVWLGWLPAASLRVGTQWRPAERHWSRLALFKPRFRLGEGDALELVPNPVASIAETYALLTDQERFLAAVGRTDLWVARSPAAYAPAGSRLLHRLALGRLALTLRERSDRDVRGWLTEERSEIRRLVVALVLAARAEAEARGARFRLLVLPDREDLADLRAHERPRWAGAVDALEAAGVEVRDLSPALRAADEAEGAALWAPGGHYSARGNAVVAAHLAALLDG